MSVFQLNKFRSFRPLFAAGLFLFLFLNSGNIRSQCSLSLFATNSLPNCFTSLTSATVTISNGTPPYTYTWLPTGGSGSVAINLLPGNYTVLAKDATGCMGNTNLLINNNTGITFNLTPTNVSCFGANDGQLSASFVGNPPLPYNYTWTPVATNTPNLSNVGPGTYTVKAKDGNGCPYTATATVTQPTSITAVAAITPIKCFGGLTSVTMTVGGGTGPTYSYSWSPGTGTNAIQNNLAAGNYSFIVTDANNCTLTQTVLITQPPSMTVNINITNVTCNTFTNGAATAIVNGGTPAYSYTWMPGGFFPSSISNLAAGNYSCTVKDSKGCTVTQSFAVTQPNPFVIVKSQKDEFCVNADGTATVTLSGGTPVYSYSWTTVPAQTSSVATGLAAGNYSCFITDANGCKTQAAFTIGNISNMNPQITALSNASCNGGCNGSATAGIAGGGGPYTYNWIGIPSGTLATVNGLCAGQYTVKITDVSGCYTNTIITITEPPALTVSVTVPGITCSGANGVVTSTVSGGTPGYSYNWMPGGLITSSVIVSPTITTTYSLTASDSKGCSVVKIFTLNVSAPLSITAGTNSLTVCPNVSTAISVFPSGGNGVYSYNWLPGNLTAQNIIVNLATTTVYTVTVTDGCGSTPVTTTVNVNIYPTPVPSFVVNKTAGCEPLCVQFSSTTTGTNTIFWNFGDFGAPVVSPVVNHCYTKGGIYSVNMTVTDNHGCKTSLLKTNLITVYPKPKADFIYSPDVIDLNSPDATFKNSSINASQYSWSMNGNLLSTDPIVNYSFLYAGCYTVKLSVSNETYCSDTTQKIICVTEGYNFWAPNAFTPDEDTHNDIFIPKGTGWSTDKFNFEVHDRWGLTVFKTNTIGEGWDGKYLGSPATDDVYVWIVFVKDIYDNEHRYNGKVVLIR